MAQKTGVAFRLIRVSTRPIFFFLIIACSRAVDVRLLPEYV